MGGFTQTDCFKMGALWGVAGALLAVILTRGWLPGALVIGAAVIAFLAVLYLAYRGCGATRSPADAALAPPAPRGPSPMEQAAVGAPDPRPVAPAPAPKPAPPIAASPVAASPVAASPVSTSPVSAPAASPAVDPAPNGAAPKMLASPRDDGADDLKQIKGVGPKLEGLLHSLGVFHFDQIASWSPAEVAWVDDRLNFKGRIARDGWVDQARVLAAGQTTEFAGRVARGEVPSSTA